MISVATLIAAGIAPTQARLFAEPLTEACARFQINTAARIAPFIANANHESGGFTRLEENLFYSKPERIREVWRTRFASPADAAPFARNPKALANKVYALRNGNGDEESGDGWRFRGRGLFQLTGRAGYRRAGDALGRPYEIAPDMVAFPPEAAMTAAWYWFDNRCNQYADAGLIDQITRAINGPAMLAANERRELTEEALKAFA